MNKTYIFEGEEYVESNEDPRPPEIGEVFLHNDNSQIDECVISDYVENCLSRKILIPKVDLPKSNGNNKWMKGLDWRLVKKILKLDIEKVEYAIDYGKSIICEIITKSGNTGFGIAICSTLDNFDLNRGKNIAAGRARKALERRSNCSYIRRSWKDFPNTWSKGQIQNVLQHSLSEEKEMKVAKIYFMGANIDSGKEAKLAYDTPINNVGKKEAIIK